MGKFHLKCKCGSVLSVAQSSVGKKAKCGGCKFEFIVPKPSKAIADRVAQEDVPSPTRAAKSKSMRLCDSCNRDMGQGTIVCIHCGYHSKLKRHLETVASEEVGDTGLALVANLFIGIMVLIGSAFFLSSMNGPQFLRYYFVLFCVYAIATPILRRMHL